MCCLFCACKKLILWILNLVVLVCGGAMVLGGVLTKYANQEVGAPIVPASTLSCYTAFGAIMIVIGLFGCVISYLTFKIAIRIYAIALLIMSLMLIILGVYGLLKGVRVTTETMIKGNIREMLANLRAHYENDTKAKTKLDRIQLTFKCCGAEEPVKIDQFDYMESCCPPSKVVNHRCIPRDIYEDRCVAKLILVFSKFFRILYLLVLLFGGAVLIAGAAAMAISYA